MASATVKASDNTKSASGSVMVLSTGGTAILTGDYSKLFGETPTAAATSPLPTSSNLPTTTESIVSSPLSSDSANNILPSSSQLISQSSSPTTTGKPDDGLTNTQLGAIIGGAAGGVLVLLCLVGCLVYHRKKKQKTFKRGRGITPSMVLDNTGFQQHHNLHHQQTHMTAIDRSFDQQSTYSFNSPQNAFGSSSSPSDSLSPTHLHADPHHNHFTPTAPSENITATVDKLYSIKQYNAPEHAPAERTNNNRVVSQASTNGARLSKYNYLTQAFSQMRASYATQDNHQQQQDRIMYDNSHQGLAKPPFVQYPDPIATSEATISSPTTSSPYSTNNPTQLASTPQTEMRDSSTTILHAPLFKRNHHSPSPSPSSSSMDAPSITLYNENNESKILHQGHALTNTVISSTPAISTATVSNKKLYFPGNGSNNNHHRDSTLSDVSQYSTFSSSSNPFRYSDDNNRSTSSPTPSEDYFVDSPAATSTSKSPLAASSSTYQSSPLSEKPYAYI